MAMDELEVLRKRLSHWRRIFDTVVDGIVIVDAEGRFSFANPGAERILGTPREEILRRTCCDPAWSFLTLDGEPMPEDHLPFTRCSQECQPLSAMEMMIRRPDGSRVVVLANTAPLPDDDESGGGIVGVFTDITATYELQRQRDDYLHMISHDLRIPLTIVHGHAQLLQRKMGTGPSEIVEQSMAAIDAGCRRMRVMIDEMVEAARLDAGMLFPEKERISLEPFLAGILEEGREALERERIEVDLPPDLPSVVADQGHLYRILVNLLTNALKFSSQGSTVRISAEKGANEISVAVSDRGEGIPEEDLPRVFTRYFRSRSAGGNIGAGLGLYITRILVQAQGGRIDVESRIGQGSTFRFTLPRA